MDTTFIIGSSGTACSGNNWNRVLSFVQALVRYFGVSPSGSHIALIRYSSDPEVALKLNTLTGSRLSVSEVNGQVARLVCRPGFNRIDKAMDVADKEVLTSSAGVRDVPRVISEHILLIILIILFCIVPPLSNKEIASVKNVLILILSVIHFNLCFLLCF